MTPHRITTEGCIKFSRVKLHISFAWNVQNFNQIYSQVQKFQSYFKKFLIRPYCDIFVSQRCLILTDHRLSSGQFMGLLSNVIIDIFSAMNMSNFKQIYAHIQKFKSYFQKFLILPQCDIFVSKSCLTLIIHRSKNCILPHCDM